MVKDNFPLAIPGQYTDAFAVTPSDATELDPKPQAIWVGGVGNLVVQVPSGTVTFTAVPAGTLIPIRAEKVMAATTATLIIALS